MKKIIISTAVMAMFASSVMAAEEAKDAAKSKRPEGKMFETLDTSKDNAISKEEWLAPHDKKFSEMDGNKDGKIVADEVKSYQTKQAEAHKAAVAAKVANKEKEKETSSTANAAGKTKTQASTKAQAAKTDAKAKSQ